MVPLTGRKGERVARDEEFAAFVAARYRALVRTGLLLAGDTGHAEDLAQSALIRTYLAWGRLRDPANARLAVPGTPVSATLSLRDDGPLAGPTDAAFDFLRKIGYKR